VDGTGALLWMLSSVVISFFEVLSIVIGVEIGMQFGCFVVCLLMSVAVLPEFAVGLASMVTGSIVATMSCRIQSCFAL